jgi:hypothetical protein
MNLPDRHSIQLAYDGVSLSLPMRVGVVDSWEDVSVWDPNEDTWAIYRHEANTHKLLILQDNAWSMTLSLLHEMMHAVQMEEAGSFGAYMAEYISQKREAGCDVLTAITNPREYRDRYNNGVRFEREAIQFSLAVVNGLQERELGPYFREAGLFCPTDLLRSVEIS